MFVALSSSEAEYRSMADTTTKIMQNLLKNLLVSLPEPIDLFFDNQSALYIAASNSVLHERTQHIERDVHVIHVQRKLMNLPPLSTTDQLVDFLNKGLPLPKFEFFIEQVGLLFYIPA
ncbi:hypothetical protein Pfo_027282 [Paulownia fortunei]|nr:hypothetical protein Pfo_027282 [Paulownia fortunei]